MATGRRGLVLPGDSPETRAFSFMATSVELLERVRGLYTGASSTIAAGKVREAADDRQRED